MIPVKSSITMVDTLPGDEVKFSISDANSAWVMRSMADLYSNRELAVVREYSTNAYDSNVEKALRDGHEPQPIHVTLPSLLNPYFVVQDHGVGMSEAELKEVYTQFGESTKRESDAYNGLLGFGSKSAVAYTNTFTITSVKDGYETVGVISRHEDEMGGYVVTLKTLPSQPTTKVDGVTIQVPVHNTAEFERKARDFYRYWLPGRVLINGSPVEQAVGEKLDDNLYINKAEGNSYVVMGNVPYQIENPSALFPRGMTHISFVAYVDNGTVEFVPAREALKYSDHTKKALHKIIDDFVAKSLQRAKDEIAAAPTHAEAYKKWRHWRYVIGSDNVENLTFKGDKLVDRFPLMGQRWRRDYVRNATQTIREWHVESMESTLIITGFVNNLASHHKTKVKEWLSIKGVKATYIIFTTATKIDSPWVDPARVVQWEKLKQEVPKPPKKPRVPNAAWGRKAGTFDTVSAVGYKSEQDVPNTKSLFYIMTQEYNNRRNISSTLSHFGIKEEVVIVPANRKEKFLRNYPKAVPILTHLKAMVKTDGPSLISDDGKKFLKTNDADGRILSKLNEFLVDDPKLKEWIKIHSKTKAEYLTEYSRQWQLCNMLGVNFKRHEYDHWNARVIHPLEGYPLLAKISSNYLDAQTLPHVYVYLNAAYAARKDKKIA